MDNDPKHAKKATQEFLGFKKIGYNSVSKPVTWPQTNMSVIPKQVDFINCGGVQGQKYKKGLCQTDNGIKKTNNQQSAEISNHM